MQMPDVFRAQELCVCVWKLCFLSVVSVSESFMTSRSIRKPKDVVLSLLCCTWKIIRKCQNIARKCTLKARSRGSRCTLLLCKPPDNGWEWVIYGVGSLCLSFTPYNIEKTTKGMLRFFCTLITFDRHRLIMMIIAGRAASEFLCLHK